MTLIQNVYVNCKEACSCLFLENVKWKAIEGMEGKMSSVTWAFAAENVVFCSINGTF